MPSSIRLGAVLFAGLLLAACSSAPPRTAASAATERSIAAVRLDPGEALADLNAYRTGLGLAPVRLDPALSGMSQTQAAAMVAANQMSHDVKGSFTSRLAAAGIATSEAGENLGAGYRSVAEAMDGWRHSPEHDANLRLARVTRFGIALAKDPTTQYGVYWAMVVAAEPPSAGSGALMLAQ